VSYCIKINAVHILERRDMENKQAVREPVVAGSFYEKNGEKLKKQVGALLATGVGKKIKVKGIMAPHAGYIYSGEVAGKVFSSVEIPRTIVILGPNHTGMGKGISVYPAGSWITPLGMVKIETDISGDIVDKCEWAEFDVLAHEREHSIEVQLPFLQVLRADISMAAICVGESNREILNVLAGAIAEALKGKDAIILASSDMTHYESADSARQKDEKVIALMEKFDADGMYDAVMDNGYSMCGVLPAYVMMKSCEAAGAKRGELVQYSNSGETSGDFSKVVGYAGVAVI
jgi:AmmeMemoRadiSam system protein B